MILLVMQRYVALEECVLMDVIAMIPRQSFLGEQLKTPIVNREKRLCAVRSVAQPPQFAGRAVPSGMRLGDAPKAARRVNGRALVLAHIQ